MTKQELIKRLEAERDGYIARICDYEFGVAKGLSLALKFVDALAEPTTDNPSAPRHSQEERQYSCERWAELLAKQNYIPVQELESDIMGGGDE